MVDAQHAGDAQVVGKGGAELRVTVCPERVWARGRESPGLALAKKPSGGAPTDMPVAYWSRRRQTS